MDMNLHAQTCIMHQPFRRGCNNGRESAHVGNQLKTSGRLDRVIHYRSNKSGAGAKLDTGHCSSYFGSISPENKPCKGICYAWVHMRLASRDLKGVYHFCVWDWKNGNGLYGPFGGVYGNCHNITFCIYTTNSRSQHKQI